MYNQEQLITDMVAVIQDNAPLIIQAGIILGAVNFILVWFFHIMFRGLKP